jgi:hypothetical protein
MTWFVLRAAEPGFFGIGFLGMINGRQGPAAPLTKAYEGIQ